MAQAKILSTEDLAKALAFTGTQRHAVRNRCMA